MLNLDFDALVFAAIMMANTLLRQAQDDFTAEDHGGALWNLGEVNEIIASLDNLRTALGAAGYSTSPNNWDQSLVSLAGRHATLRRKVERASSS